MNSEEQYTAAILRPTTAFLPELDAISSFLSMHRNLNVRFVRSMRELQTVDIGVAPLGLTYPFTPLPKLSIGLYSSTSVGRLRGVRDAIKRTANSRFDYFLYQNDHVLKTFHRGSKPYGYLPMGFFPDLVKQRKHPVFDLIYSGTTRRTGLSKVINQLCNEGLRVCIVGAERTPGFCKSIYFAGRLPIDQVYELYSQAEFGLNFVPAIEPYTHQASTKCIEYFASGLKVVSNRYEWVERFVETRGGRVNYLEPGIDQDSIRNFDYVTPAIDDLSWPSLLSKSGLKERIQHHFGEALV